MTPPAFTDVLDDAHGGAVPNTGTVRRAREQAVPCQRCGAQRTPTGLQPRTLTENLSALCDRHETPATAPPHLPAGDTAVAPDRHDNAAPPTAVGEYPGASTENSATGPTAAVGKETLMTISSPAPDSPAPGSSASDAGSRLGRGAVRVVVTLLATVSLMSALAVSAYAQVPDFTPTQPNGGNELLKIGGMLKWIAIYGCSAAFFGGLCCLAGGRLLDHRGAHKIGIGLMFSAVGVAILSGTGVALLNAFASGN